MGLVGSQARLIFLHTYRKDIEHAMSKISRNKMMLIKNSQIVAARETKLFNAMDQYGMDNPYIKNALQEDEAVSNLINTYEKQLDAQMKTLETELKMMDQEIESVQKMVDKNIQLSKPNLG